MRRNSFSQLNQQFTRIRGVTETSQGQNETTVPRHRQKRFVAVMIVIVATASYLTIAFAILPFFNNGTIACGTSNTPVSARFTVYIDYVNRQPLPRMNITLGQTITIHALNNSTVTHSFAIAQYFDKGAVLLPGQSCDLTFTASQAGSFWVYSAEPDPIFALAQLNVNPLNQTSTNQHCVCNIGASQDEFREALQSLAKPHRVNATPDQQEDERVHALTQPFVDKISDRLKNSPHPGQPGDSLV